MTHVFKKIFASFLERPDVWFFYGFLITFTLSIRKVLFFYPINGAFNEYTGIYLYLSDIFLFLTIATWLFILCNKYSVLSIFKPFAEKCSTWNILIKNYTQNVPRMPRSNKMFHMEHFVCSWGGTFICLKKVYKQVINNYTIIFPLLLAFFSFLSILWSTNQSIAIFRSIKLFEFILLYFYIIYNVPRGTFLEKIEDKKCSTWNIFGGLLIIIIISGFIQSIIGFLQFFRNSSIGLIWLKESVLSPEISGVAKIIFDGIVHIRSYGLFPHPNIFGGFLVFSIIATLLYFKMFHVEHFEKNLSQAKLNSPEPNCSTWNNLKESMGKIVPRVPRTMFNAEHLFWGGTILMQLFILIQAAALLLTFSKSALIGLFIGFLYIAANNAPFNVPRPPRVDEQPSRVEAGGTFSKDPMFKMFHVEHFWKKVFLATAISILLFFIFKPDMQTLFLKSLNERITYLNVSRGTFFENPFFGTGIGQFVPNLKNVTNLEIWQFQPVHNVFLLILNELGIFIFIGFIFFIYKIFHPSTNVPRGTLYEADVEHYVKQTITVPQNTLNKNSSIISNNIIIIYIKALLIAFVFIMLFDHYLWDIQQGQIMFWIIIGLIATSQRKRLL